MTEHRIFGMPFARIYPLYVNKVERKGRRRDEDSDGGEDESGEEREEETAGATA